MTVASPSSELLSFEPVTNGARFRSSDLPIGAGRRIEVNGRGVLVVNIDGTVHAVRDACPHQGARLSSGGIAGTMRSSAPGQLVYGDEGCIARCPWHGWEFDIRTGRALFDPDRVSLARYRVIKDADWTIVTRL